jgi:hypothetical protein
VRRAVRTGHAGPVEHDGHRLPVQGDVHQELVEGPVEERRVDGDDRVQATHRQPGRRGERVLLGDADVEGAFGEPLGERGQPRRVQHRRGDRHDVGPIRADPHQLVGERRRPVAGRDGAGPAVGVEDAGRVPGVDLVGLGRRVAEALGGDGVDDHRATERPGPAQRRLHGADVVPVDRAHVLQAEVLEHPLRGQDVLEALLDRVQCVVQRRPDDRSPAQRLADGVERVLVPGPQPQGGERVRHSPDRRRVRAAVVVDHDDHRAVLRGGDVVQRLPGHAPGEGAVADDGHDGTGVTADGEGLGQPVGIGQRRGRVAVLHPVVLALAAARVTGEPAALAEPLEALDPAGQHLVHVGLVAGVEDDRLAGGLEDAVQGDGQLDAAEVGAQVPTGLRDAGDQRVADLGRQGGQRFGREDPQIFGAPERSQERHGSAVSSRSAAAASATKSAADQL